MKTCTKCKLEQTLDNFGNNKSKPDGKQVWCKPCVKEHNADYYKRTPERNPERLAHRRKVTLRNRKFMMELLQKSSCIDCGQDDWRVLEFDHVRGVKSADVSNMVKSASIQALQDEIAKCDIKCANCHRIKTFIEQGWYASVAEGISS